MMYGKEQMLFGARERHIKKPLLFLDPILVVKGEAYGKHSFD
jgi:hypothetical protein